MQHFFGPHRPGSVIADLTATFLNNAVAEDIFFARLNSLDLDRLFADSPVLGSVPGMSIF